MVYFILTAGKARWVIAVLYEEIVFLRMQLWLDYSLADARCCPVICDIVKAEEKSASVEQGCHVGVNLQ